MGNFFLESDFSAFDIEKSKSRDKLILERRRIVAEKLRELHNLGLLEFMNSRGLNSHWEKQYITSITWPVKKINDDYVDGVYISYGKNRDDITRLIKVLGLLKELEGNRIEDDKVFKYIPQLQLGLNSNSWNTSLYLDELSYVEQRNLVNKIRLNNELKNRFKNILMALEDKGYKFYILKDDKYWVYNDETDYLDDIIKYTDSNQRYGISIKKDYSKDYRENNRNTILEFLKDEFENLMDAYYFVSWDYSENNYLR